MEDETATVQDEPKDLVLCGHCGSPIDRVAYDFLDGKCCSLCREQYDSATKITGPQQLKQLLPKFGRFRFGKN